VRYQLVRLFHTALEEHGSQPATAKTMIDSSAQRVLREYRSQPELQGQIVITLAELYGALEDVEGTSALLDNFIKEAGPDTDPAALADARQKLANMEVLKGHTARGTELISQAEAFWNQHPDRYPEERLDFLAVKSRVQRANGDLDGAEATERVAIAQRIARSGRAHRETAVLYNSHAITLTAAGRLDEALAAYRETVDIYKAVGLGNELDTQIIIGNMGTLEVRMGHLRDAEELLRTALDRERALAGDSAAVSSAMGPYAGVLTTTGRSAQALPIAKESVDMANRYAGPSSPVFLQNLLVLADAELANGDAKAARAALIKDRDVSLDQYGPKHLWTLRAQVWLANLDFKQGQASVARAELVPAIAQLRDLGKRGEAVVAQGLQYLGEIDFAAGNPAAAAESLREAVSILSRYAATGWNMAVARERLGEALLALRQPGAADELNQAVSVMSREVGPDHAEVVRAKTALRALDKATPVP
jgi:eukaryotic-like serine/threonine-protein kinase